jgi:hypothetical protein
VVLGDTSVDADSFAFAEVALGVANDTLALTCAGTAMSDFRAVKIWLGLTKPSG